MIRSMHSNPIYHQLAVRHGGLMNLAATTLFVSIIGGWVKLFYPLLVMYNPLLVIGNMFRVSGLSIALLAIGSALAAIITATASSQSLRSSAYLLLVVSPIPNARIVRGHLWAAVSRLRVVWAAMLAALLVFWATISVANYNLTCAASYFYSPCRTSIPDVPGIVQFAPIMAALTVFTISFNALILCVGLATLLKTRSRAAAITTSLTTVALFAIPAGWALWGFFSRATTFRMVYGAFTVLSVVCIAVLIGAYIFAIKVARSG